MFRVLCPFLVYSFARWLIHTHECNVQLFALKKVRGNKLKCFNNIFICHCCCHSQSCCLVSFSSSFAGLVNCVRKGSVTLNFCFLHVILFEIHFDFNYIVSRVHGAHTHNFMLFHHPSSSWFIRYLWEANVKIFWVFHLKMDQLEKLNHQQFFAYLSYFLKIHQNRKKRAKKHTKSDIKLTCKQNINKQ